MAKEHRDISAGAFRRLQRLQEAHLKAVERLRAGDDYPDFFVEGSDPPWHEMWPEVITPGEKRFSDDRMLFVDRLGQDDYPDFFVEGSDPPWHERWPEVVSGQFDPGNVQHRMRALTRLSVVQAFMRMQERTRK
jgi:hypothetical protein